LAAVVIIVTAVNIVTDFGQLALALPLLVIAAGAAWVAISRYGGRRTIALIVAAVAVLGIVIGPLFDDVGEVVAAVLRVAMLVLSVVLARYALGRTVRAFKARATPGQPVAPAERGVLIMNLKSGGGKAERFDLVNACRERGIRPVVLEPGDDLRTLARQAIADGADAIGMAGGDGSQALVATVAAEHGVPMVVVPAGTRNHLALDLGLDRDDVVGALDAYGAAVERTVDLADVNGQVFVNNVSLGLYATIVASPEYRAAKVDTTLAMLPNMLGPGTKSFDLQYRGPNGQAHDGAHIIQISNNPYRKGTASRPRMDTGKLGVYALEIKDDRAAAGLLAAIAAGDVDRFSGFNHWETEIFEVASRAPIDVGLDGEALVLDPPLRFSTRPAALRVRLPTDAIGVSPAARKLEARQALKSLWATALGRPGEDTATVP
jgi:diacylglycerol kinase family enzyme